MAEIQVVSLQNNRYEVTVIDRTTTTHHVTVNAAYADALTQGACSHADLVQQSFAFLLAREPNTSILRSFDLSVIAQYFPDYEQHIRHPSFTKHS